jgi:uncharacterized protein with PQ loop repeat
MLNKNRISIKSLIILQIIIPFSVSIWLFWISGVFKEFMTIILSSNQLLGALILSFAWILELGKMYKCIQKSKKDRALNIIFHLSLSVWLFWISGIFKEFLIIILSNNQLLGALLLSFIWIGGIGKVSELIRQSKKTSKFISE